MTYVDGLAWIHARELMIIGEVEQIKNQMAEEKLQWDGIQQIACAKFRSHIMTRLDYSEHCSVDSMALTSLWRE